jgi:hypothetical protein
MAAAAFKASLTVRNAGGQEKMLYLTASDVNAAALVFPSGGTELQLSSLPCIMKDLVLSAAGTDTTNMSLFVNGVNTGIVLLNAANLYSAQFRQVASSPIQIPAGALVKLVQNT